jgi:phosphatidylglycerophosphatase A
MTKRGWPFWIATGLGSGLSPVAPGTVGAAVALIPAYYSVKAGLPAWTLPLIAAALFVPASRVAERAGEYFGKSDPGAIVIDEVIGQWIALGAASLIWQDWLAAFCLFRLFDIWKPFPIGRLERLRGGYGVVADDVGSGVCAMMSLFAAQRLGLW